MPEIRSRAVYNTRSVYPVIDDSMDISAAFPILFGIAYLGLTIYVANQQQVTGAYSGLLRALLYVTPALPFLYGLLVLQAAYFGLPAEAQTLTIDPATAELNFAITVVISIISMQLIASNGLRQFLRRLLPADATYDPEAPLHTTALVLMLLVLWMTISQFVLGGGITGMAEELASNQVGFGDILFEQVLWISAATLGVGYLLRRTGMQSLARLGLRLPTAQDFNWGIGVGVLLFGFVIVLGVIWSQSVSPQELQQQTAASDQFAQSFNSLPLALLVSVVVAIGEEIFFRGALQPVFGIWLTSFYFAALHTQYTLTPATLAIVVTALGLGWLRRRYSTSASIVGHFVYNFIQLALAILVGASP